MFKIRSLKSLDLPSCASIMVEVFKEEPYQEKWTKSRALRKIQINSKGSLSWCLGAFENERLVGFLLAVISPWNTHDSLFIYTLAVKKAFQRQGIGEALLKELAKRAKTKKIPAIFLNSHTKSKAYEFYKKQGFYSLDWVKMVKKAI